ncbi:serine hydrolase [Sphingomonas sp. 28-63-12]|uniref:serine hydrolase domain-containing protein n=1 Tax=Sphingomonas sp. 28-63-12 TaxID=1970434 RepID=UPI000BCAA24D|nr:MAG: serine hydrolase [Sphingomonas sp. 28-63-12]
MRLRFIAPCLALLGVTTSSAAIAQAISPQESAQIDKLVAESLASTGVPSASIAIVRGGEIVLTKAYGKQSETIKKPRIDAPYQIASVSKQFTAAALLLLEDEGKLSLDDTVAKYLPGITDGDKITIRQLLSHTSGLQDYWPQDYSFQAMETPTTPQKIVDRWAKKPLDYAPGTKWQYSNTGYVVAGMIVEKVAGMSLIDFLQAHVFKPLGMTAKDQDLATGKNDPQGYHRYALGPVRVAQPAAYGWLFAAGELSMSPTDLAKWDIARINRTVLPADDWVAQETPVVLPDGKNTNYGLGVFTATRDGRRYVEHGGEAVGFLTENIVYPDDKAAIVVAVNADFGGTQGTIARAIADLILPAKTATAAADPEIAKTAQARAVFEAMRAGTLDKAMMTENWNYFFTGTAAADYRASLAPLGEPTSFDPLGPPRLRGGFVNRNYRVTYPDRKLVVVSYAEPGEQGRYEQFLVMPAE